VPFIEGKFRLSAYLKVFVTSHRSPAYLDFQVLYEVQILGLFLFQIINHMPVTTPCVLTFQTSKLVIFSPARFSCIYTIYAHSHLPYITKALYHA